MKLIRSPQEAEGLIQAHFLPGVRTNHFPAAGETAAEIAAGDLWAGSWPGGLAFFHRKTGYWRMTFYLNDSGAPFTGELPVGTVAAEIAQKPGMAPEDVDFWLRSGFALEERRSRMVRSAALEPLDASWPVRRGCPGDQEGVAALLKDRFHPAMGCIPEREALLDLLTCGSFFVAGTNRVEGVVSLREERAHGQLRHLAVRRDFEGAGIGSALVSAVSRAERKNKTILWTAEGDTAARRLYERHGYRCDGWRSSVLLHSS